MISTDAKRPLIFIAGLILLIFLLALVVTWQKWVDHVDYVHPDMHIEADPADQHHQRYIHFLFHHNDWLTDGGRDEVRILWPPARGWVANVTLDLDKATLFGGAGNGITFSAPYPGAKPAPIPLSGKQVAAIRDCLAHLSPGESYEVSRLKFAAELHIAFYQNGVLQIRHYPASQLPPEIVKMGDSIQVRLMQQR